jgi:hypothetical protein
LRDKELGGTPKRTPPGSVWFLFIAQLLQIFCQLATIILDDGVNSGSNHRRNLPAQLFSV